MRILLMLFAFAAGALQPLQAAINSQLAQRGATFLWAAAISAGVTAVTLGSCAIFLWRLPPPSFGLIAQTPGILWTGGVLGAVILGMMTAVVPRLGAATMFVCFLSGIMACSLMLDHMGLLGLPQQSPSAGKLFGAVLIVAAAILVRLF